jgi:glyoxylase-like metal-dependent hydrolase (beta-lactamase superfamily II)
MRFKTFSITLLLLILATLPCAAETVEGLNLHVKALAPGVVRIWAGDHISSTAVCAIATRKGIVVIDSTDIPRLDKTFRQVIARELGRSDFTTLINTHGHGDHTNGNGVYSDCQIIAHETVPAMMQENFSNMPQGLTWKEENIQRQQAIIDSDKSSAEQKAAAGESIIISKLGIEFIKSNPKPTLPGKTFKDKLVLDFGDTTLELLQSGGTHTRSDIFIFVPQKKILFTGDMMADKWLTDTPGCLATFAVRTGTAEDFPILFKNWQSLIDRQAEITQYIPGHWNGELSFDGFQKRFEYAKTMVGSIKTLVHDKGDFNHFVGEHTLAGRFPQLVNSPGLTNQGHQMTINHLYVLFSGRISLGDAIQRLLQGDRFAAEFDRLKQDVLKSRDRYFFNEAEINNVAYFIMQQLKKPDEAMKLFELNVELFPDSWNTYDSLGEACHSKGDKQKALKLYRKSVELNPANENGKKIIGQLEKE